MQTQSLSPAARRKLINLIRIEDDLLRRKASTCLHSFAKYMWRVIEPETPFKDGWHIQAICKHLEAVANFDIKNLVINEPPRHMKSIITCVMWPAWVWGTRPHLSFIFGSHSMSLSQRDSIKTRQIIESERYHMVFSKADWTLADDQNKTSIFSNSQGGSRRAVGVGTKIVGQGGDFLVVDDPNDSGEIHSSLHRENVIYWYDKVLSSRVNNPKRNAKVVVMQRLHEEDLSGHIYSKYGDKYDRLVLPGRYNKKVETEDDLKYMKSKTTLGFIDPREQDGDILWPEQWDEESLDGLAESLEENAEAQINQNPVPNDGGLFPKSQWLHYDAPPSPILSTVTFVDCAQKPGLSNDYSVFATWARTHMGFYLLGLTREKTDAPLLESLTENIYNTFKPDAMVIEDKSAGSSLIQHLRKNTTIPAIAYDPKQRDKVVRATAATPTVKAGKCYLPRRIAGTVKERGVVKQVNLIDIFKNEHESFPKGKNDDTVDTTSMMVEYFLKSQGSEPRIRTL